MIFLVGVLLAFQLKLHVFLFVSFVLFLKFFKALLIFGQLLLSDLDNFHQFWYLILINLDLAYQFTWLLVLLVYFLISLKLTWIF